MHKKTAIATGVALMTLLGAASTAQAQSKVQLWGIVDAAVRHTDNQADGGSLTTLAGGGMSQGRWGLKVEEDLGGGTKALVELENRFNTDDGSVSTPFFQLSYVGIQGPFGRLTMGRQWNVLFDVVTSTYASFPYSPYMDAYKPELGMAAGARTSNALKYTLATPDRRWVSSLQYSFGENNKTAALEAGGAAAAAAAAAAEYDRGGDVLAQRAAAGAGLTNYLSNSAASIRGLGLGAMETVGGYLRYSANGLSIGGGYLRTQLPGGSDLDAWTAGGSYRSGKLYVNVGYGLNKFKPAHSDNPIIAGTRVAVDRAILSSFWGGQTNGGFQAGAADKRTMVKVGFGYQLTPKVNAGLHYFHAKQSGDVTARTHNGKAHFMIAAVDYAFSKRTDAYFAVDHTKINSGNSISIDAVSGGQAAIKKRTGITVGLRHRF